ncbi:enoyl-CoA hydratase [Neptunomonas concharum]|uniref:Enoyl-CoA hydratase n=1 Tax=Neptunomonas concharum TaxID=1031538 RepID=A0A5P1RB62_9GAMM|nr:enoyl-CoA hydratase [Neptunomonas concharum]QEQ96837.1 enoyl-CoA hydratase [Neptunomonas concharum]
MTDKLIVEKQGNIAVITMNNPPANTWTEESLKGLAQVVKELNEDRSIFSLVLKSDSEKFFSAGADLNLFADGDRSVARDISRYFGEAFETLSQFRGVSIAAINGWAMGGGLEVALACDIRIAEEQVQMALPEAAVGLLPCAGGTQNLTMLVGEGWAKKMILCGERVKAPKALEIGLVEEVVEKGESANRAIELATQVANQSPVAVAACKQLIQSNRTRAWDQGYILERELFVDLFHTEDQKEGVNAFLEKRKPEWKNR